MFIYTLSILLKRVVSIPNFVLTIEIHVFDIANHNVSAYSSAFIKCIIHLMDLKSGLVETTSRIVMESTFIQAKFECHALCFWRCPWCNGYRCRKWTQQHEFKSWTRLIAFYIALIPLGKV